MRGVLVCVLLLLHAVAVGAGEDAPQAKPSPYSEIIEVTASRVEQPLLDTPVAVTVIDRQQIETSPADNYADLLRGVPGVNAIQGSALHVVARTRGATKVFEDTQLVLLDGRSVYLDYAGQVIYGLLPVSTDELKAVEVVRGPGSAVWGPNAMSGVINLRTRSPRDMEGGFVTASVGEHGTHSVTARYADVLGPWSYKVSGGLFAQDPWPRDNLLPDGSPFPLGYAYDTEGSREPKFDLRVDREVDSGSTLSLRGGYAGIQGTYLTSIGPSEITPGAHVAYTEADYTRGVFHAKAYWNHLNGDSRNLYNNVLSTFESDTSVVEVNHRTLAAGRHMLVYGASYRHNHFDLSAAPNQSVRRDAGVYLEDIFEIGRSVEVNAGGRLDYFSTLGTVFSPRLSLIYKPLVNHAIRVAANRAYRAPTLLENYLYVPVPNGIFLPDGTPFLFLSAAVGNEDLAQESVDALEVGWSWQRGPLFISAAAYRNVTEDKVVFFPVSFYSPEDPPAGWAGEPATVPSFAMVKEFSYRNVGTERNQGLELSIDARFRGGWSGRAAYSYQDEPEVTSHVGGVPLFVNRPPRHMGSLSAQRRSDPWLASLSYSYTGRAFWSDVLDPRFWGYSKPYSIVSGSFGYSVTRTTELVLSGTNLFDRPIKQHAVGDIIGRKLSFEVRQRF